MLETMHDAHGIGLAAQQIGRALQLATVDVTGVEDRPSRMEVNGERPTPEDHMPLIPFNPEWTAVGDATEVGPEGCLSFPEVYGDVKRPEEIDVSAMDEKGEAVAFRGAAGAGHPARVGSSSRHPLHRSHGRPRPR